MKKFTVTKYQELERILKPDWQIRRTRFGRLAVSVATLRMWGKS